MAETITARGAFTPPETIVWPEGNEQRLPLMLTSSGEANPDAIQRQCDYANYDKGGVRVHIAGMRRRFSGTETYTDGRDPGTHLKAYAGFYPGNQPARRGVELTWEFPDMPWPPSAENAGRYNAAMAVFARKVLADYAAVLEV